MKKTSIFSLLFIGLLAFGLTACGDDNNNGGSGAAPDYIGLWVLSDTETHFEYVELTATTWTNVNYRVRNNSIEKRNSSGGLSVNGNQVHLTGGASFTDATYAVSGNTMTLQIVQNGQIVETVQVHRISSADAAAKVAAWEALYIASQNSQNNR